MVDYYHNTNPAVYAANIAKSDTYSTARLYKGFWADADMTVVVYTKDGAAAPTTLKVGAYQFVPLQIYGVLSTGTDADPKKVYGLYD